PKDSLAIVRAQELILLMPDPQHIEIKKYAEKNWFNWFDLSNLSFDVNNQEEMAFGRGCRWPCQHCIRGNRLFRSRNDPLPVVIKKIMISREYYSNLPHNPGNKLFSGWFRND
ncbi:MAG: hypothetical protein NTW13_06045, partial [Candidatus Omnitrophica bacterium]|nr:hypothetical protein [Candidatus Omnitrophota bacterium]